MQVKSYVSNKIEKAGITVSPDRIFGNLAVAGIYRDSVVTADTATVIDSLFSKLKSKLAITAAPNNQKRKATIEPADQEKVIKSQSYTKSLLAGRDPATGEALNEVILMGTTKALHNPSTRVVYPIPGSKNLPAYI